MSRPVVPHPKLWIAVVVTLIILGGFYISQKSRRPSECAKSYDEMTKDGVLNITVVFGYKDARPARFVSDRYERAYFTDVLLRPCTGDEVICGFSNELANPEFFARQVYLANGKKGVLQVQVLASSVGPDDEVNRKNPTQQWHSERTEKLFRHALLNSDVVFYNGHSRAGGGPDFFPPKIFHSGMIKYELYKEAQPGLSFLLESLRETKKQNQPKIFGMFSCASNNYFLNRIRKVKPEIGLISSDALLYHRDAMTSMIAALGAIVRGECEDSFNRALNFTDPRAGSRISGFF